MLKRLAMAALTAVTVSALAQTQTTTTTNQTTTTTTDQATGTTQTTTETTTMAPGPGMERYDSYNIGSADVNTISEYDRYMIVMRNARDINAGRAFNLRQFLSRMDPEEESVLLKALVSNYKTACAVRDEVAMARYGTSSPYTWLAYPPLVWTDTPGVNSWSTLNFGNGTTTTTTTTTPVTEAGTNEEDVTLTQDQSRPMRMLMSHPLGYHDLNYEQARDILCAGLDTEAQGVIVRLFHEVNTYRASATAKPAYITNETGMDAIIALIKSNAMMVHYLNRWSWYNHFDPDYYTSGRWQYGN